MQRPNCWRPAASCKITIEVHLPPARRRTHRKRGTRMRSGAAIPDAAGNCQPLQVPDQLYSARAEPDRPREACGIFGIFAPGEDAARITYFGLYALQHRGQESAGIASGDCRALYRHRQLALLARGQVPAIPAPCGVRPVAVGRLQDPWVIASETCAIETVGGEPVRDIAPGEIVVLSGDGESGMRSHVGQASRASAACLFEYIYFARPDSSISDRSLYLARQRMGAELAHEFAVPADLVIGVPDSATPTAACYAAARALAYAGGLIKNRYIGRTFIQPDQRLRQLGVKLKFNALNAVPGGKPVGVLHDSGGRGTTIPPLGKLLPDAGPMWVR